MKNRAFLQTVFAALLLIICLGAYALWYSALGSASDRVALLQTEVAQKNASVAEAADSLRQLQNLSSVENELGQYFVEPDGIVTFLEGLQSLGTTLGTKVSVVSVAANPSPRPHLDLSLSIEGPFDAVMRTVGAVEYSPYDITVKTATVDSGGNAPGDWSAALTLAVGTASSTQSQAATATTTP